MDDLIYSSVSRSVGASGNWITLYNMYELISGCCAATLVGEKTDGVFLFIFLFGLRAAFRFSIAYCYCQNQTVPSDSSTSLYSVAGEETFGHQPVATGPDDHMSEALIQ